MHQPKPNILIVDDDLVYRFAATKTIAATGLAERIEECNDGLEALTLLKKNIGYPENLPDVIFLDINMPTMDGWEFLIAFEKIVSEFSKTMHIYMVTSSIDKHDIQRSKEFATVSDYLVKPIYKETFSKILSTVHV
jgi:CheY-like chemotaxis protein